MDLTFKQKLIVFGVMLGIFMCSVFIKQWIDAREVSPNVSNGAAVSETVTGSEVTDNEENYSEIVIDVEGAVVYPGIVKLSEGSRIYEAIEKAGGLLETADTRYVNLAEEIADGSIIYVPFQGENSQEYAAGTSQGGESSTNLININTAGKDELMQLPGIGEAYAQAIIDYRSSTGSFRQKEDLMNVSGIGEAKFAKIEPLICVY